MIGFSIDINGRHECTAVLTGRGVLTTILTRVLRRGEAAESVDVVLSGLDSDAEEHLKWLDRSLSVGDEVLLRVVELDEADRPAERTSEDPEEAERARRRYYERLKKEYEDADS